MPATVTLEENGRIVHIVFKDPLTFEDFTAVEKQASAWADTSPYNLHTFMDVRELRHLPQGFLKLRNTVALTKIKTGTTVIVGASIYIQKIAATIFTVTRNKNFRFFNANEADEALKVLRQAIAIEQPALSPEPAS